MFIVHGISGRIVGPPQQALGQVRGPGAVDRARRLGAVGSEAEGAADQATAGGPGPAAHPAHPALAAYAAAAPGAGAPRVRARVADVMSQPALTLALHTPLLQAWQRLSHAGYGQAPVVNAAGALVGLLLRADLLRPDDLAAASADAQAWLDWRDGLARPVSALMWTPVPAAAPDTDLRQLARLLLDTGLPGLPVADDAARVIGFVSRSDILRAVTTEPPLDLWT